jgi:hypothetical protein
VLLVDLDPQGQLGKVLGVDVGAARRTALDLLLDTMLGPPCFPTLRATTTAVSTFAFATPWSAPRATTSSCSMPRPPSARSR